MSTQTKQQEKPEMKKKIAIIAIAVIAMAAVVAPTLASWDMDGKHDPSHGNLACWKCKGTGIMQAGCLRVRCSSCNGTGFNGGY